GTYLVKPNLFTTRTAQEGATTDLRVVKAVAEVLKEADATPVVGECPAMASYARPDVVFDGLGARGLCEMIGVKLNVLDREPPVKAENPEAEVVGEFWFPRFALDCDGIVNLPKLKTHVLTTLTCAVKNLYGLQQGGQKAHYHVVTENDPERFSRLLVDLYQTIKKQVCLTVVDAVIGMEGEGPTTGDPVDLGLIIAGDDPLAVDVVASRVIGWDPMEVGTNFIAVERGLGKSLDGIEVLGAAIEEITRTFEKPRTHQDGQPFIDIRMPIVCDGERCTGCGICSTVCPGKAIEVDGTPQFDDELCIQCFCCIELCPNGALKAVRTVDP
ncbi:DUF362 domain-containing protein, partial [Candidatus Bathyarchaeota archaeon]